METNISILNISLPNSLKRYVKERVTEKQYSTVSDYIRSLIRDDQREQERERLEYLLLEGMASGSRVVTPKEWEALKQDILTTIKR